MNSANPVRKTTRSKKKNRSSQKRCARCSRPKGEVTRHTFYVRLDLLEKVRGYAHWERIGISELINQILEEFFEGKEVKPKPRRKRLRYRR